VLNYLRVRVGDETLAEELTAATFAQAFAKRHQLRNVAAFPGWLFRIAHNELAQHFRRRANRGTVAVDFDFLAALPAPDLQPDEVIARQQQGQVMLRALLTLPPREQEMLDLKFVAGLSNIQVAEATGLTPSNVGVIIFRALRKLRAAMESMP
jgi:RNA polymerase sigma-70 factor (ECF subfamily)